MRISKGREKVGIERNDINILNEIKLNIFLVCLGICLDRIAFGSFSNNK